MMTDPQATASRPPVSVVMPFAGTEAELEDALERLAEIRTGPGDELTLVWNRPPGAPGRADRGRVAVVVADRELSSYHARNTGAAATRNPWLLFIDADCIPAPDLLDRFFDPAPTARVGALAGALLPDEAGSGLLARWAASRSILDQRAALAAAGGPAAATANLLVRRSAWESVGGFYEGLSSGADFDFCWRLAERGWEIELRAEALVRHRHRTTLAGVIRQMRRYGAGNAWQARRRPGSTPTPRPLRSLAQAAAGCVVFALTLQPRRAALKAVDGIADLAKSYGWIRSNAATPVPAPPGPRGDLVVCTDRYPVPSETFVASEALALRRLGHRIRVEAVARPATAALPWPPGIGASFAEDEGPGDRAVALARLVARHPLRCLADLAERRRYDPAERWPLRAIAPLALRLLAAGSPHVHVHFAALASANALRAGRIAGSAVSVCAHAHEVFVTPRALRHKLRRATFAAATARFVVDHLEALEPRAEVHEVVMGVDAALFRPGGGSRPRRTVAALGRYVPKKGFEVLLEAVALLDPGERPERVVVAGDGPLRPALEELRSRLGLEGVVELPGDVWGAPAIRALFDGAALAAAPCVIAPDGDRDTMPVAVKEAMAMELPVVASDALGLPELVDDSCGRLVPPGDPAALAGAIAELLSLPEDDRLAMGRTARARVTALCDVDAEARKLSGLISAAR